MHAIHSGGPTRAPALPRLTLPTSRRRYGGLLVSLAVHGALILLLVRSGERVWSRTLAPGDPALAPGGGGGGGGGGPRVAYITLPPIPEPVAPRQTTITAPVVRPRVEPKPIPTPTPPQAGGRGPRSSAAAHGFGPTRRRGERAGPRERDGSGHRAGRRWRSRRRCRAGYRARDGPGTGPGTGGGGAGGAIRPPELRDLAFPFDTPPKELRGASLAVTFWVRVDGRVERYEVEPAIADRDYARKFDEVIRAFRFTPARAPDGTTVAGTTR